MGSTNANGSNMPTSGNSDPACIVGMACRLPGEINSISGLWEFLMRKGSSQGPVPAQRFNQDGFYSSGSSTHGGVMDVPGGYFINDDVRAFDNSFFGIHNLEAASMDPQQRKLLEIVYECLENAGVSQDRISGTNTGVFVGNFTLDHQTMQSRDIDAIHRFSATGCGTTILANRISHVFNLQGPSVTLDTACSSSLYALHSAVAALDAGDCDSAVVAAVNLIMSPEQCIAAAKSGVLSPTGTCHTFDVEADGYGRAEGMNAIYLKRLSNAIRDKDKIWAVVRGTAVNANGKTPGITQPSAALQEAVIRKAYSKAGLDFSESDYVEFHGTGTPVGDPIEVDAISRCFTIPTKRLPLLIGSSKPGLGHSEAASGLTAVIKVAMALDHGKIPPTYGVKILNPKLRLDSLNMKVVTEAEQWPRKIRRASVNAFGYGGANAHVILEGFESYLGFDIKINPSSSCLSTTHGATFVLPVSASSSRSLEKRVHQIRNRVEAGDRHTLQTLAYTLGERTSHLSARSVLYVRPGPADKSPEVLNLNDGQENGVAMGAALPVAMVFTGQGAQYANMGKDLLLRNEIFRGTIRSLDATLQGLLTPEYVPEWTLENALLEAPEISRVHQAIRSQPLCTAIQIALVDLLQSWGIKASAVVGHSSGEIAAAYAAGLLSAPQAIIIAYFRGWAVDKMTNKGAMIAAGIHADMAEDLIKQAKLEDEVSIACVNSPESVTLSGTIDGTDHLMTELQKLGKFTRKLRTGDRAYHSVMMEEVGELYEDLLAANLPCEQDEEPKRRLTAKMFSSVQNNTDDGTVIIGRESMSARYWRQNLQKPVQFSLALNTLLEGYMKVHLVEVGPHPTLKGPVQQIRSHLNRDHLSVPYSCTLIRGRDSDLCMKQLSGNFFLRNQSLLWNNVNSIKSPSLPTNLPPYPWDYSSGLLWHEPRASIELRNRRYPRHELLGSQQVGGNGIDWTWRNVCSLSEVSWLRDHKLESQIVFPASCYLAMAIEALSQIQPSTLDLTTPFELRHVTINTALMIPDDDTREGVELHTSLWARKISTSSISKEWHEFSISSFAAGKPTVHCSGSIRILRGSNSVTPAEPTVMANPEEFEEWPNMGLWYHKFSSEGLNFGPSFQSVERLQTDSFRTNCEAKATTRLVPVCSAGLEKPFYRVHPITIDACIQVAIMGSGAGDVSETHVYLPVFIDECRICPTVTDGCEAFGIVKATSNKTSPSTRRMSSSLWSAGSTTKRLLLHLQGVRVTQYKAALSQALTISRKPCLRVRWKPHIGLANAENTQALQRHMEGFVGRCRDKQIELTEDEGLAGMGALVDLAGHLNPSMRVLELRDDGRCGENDLLKLIGDGTGFRRCKSWDSGTIEDTGLLKLQDWHSGRNDSPERPVDLLIVHISYITTASMDHVRSYVSDHGLIIARNTTTTVDLLRQGRFTVIEFPDSRFILASRERPRVVNNATDLEAVLVVYNPSAAVINFAEILSRYLERQGVVARAELVAIHQIESIQLQSQTICISLVELEHAFLACMDQRDMDSLRYMTDRVSSIMWICGEEALGNNPIPDLGLCHGFSRALMLEQPSLKFIILDIGRVAHHETVTYANIAQVIMNTFLTRCTDMDKEYVQKDGLLYIGRFDPDLDMNSLFSRRLGTQDRIMKSQLSAARPAKLVLGSSGSSETIHFEQLREPISETRNGFIDVLVKATSLNPKDLYAIQGRLETRGATTSLEFSGVVATVGPDIKHLKPGDSVVVGMPCQFATSQRVPVWAAHKLLPGEKHTVMCTLPTIYGTALYALVHRANLRAGESILIHGGAGAFGFAAITIAKRILGTTANIYTTAGSDSRKAFIADKLRIPDSNIFNSRTTSFAEDIMSSRGGRGVDVVVNFLTGDLLQASWECLSQFGRFVEIGKRDLLDAGKLDMHVFLRNATFTAFDFSDLYYRQMEQHDSIFSSLIAELLGLYRSGNIEAPPITTFRAAEAAEAYRHFSHANRLGKVVISFEDEESEIPVAPSRDLTLFDPRKVYLMIGCLGGLGRSLSRWMVTRGARRFVFIGRSGCDKPIARKLISRLQASGAIAKVVRGDVSNRCDVDTAISACQELGGHLGGVVQAAMGLHEALFTHMTSEQWQKAVQPKWKGTWNIHHALEGHDQDLDFFLLTSSLSGSVGTATESNYCAANGFLDAFARWRRSQGKPAISVGLGMISEVGYLHEHPEVEALLLRKGIQPLNEEEFLHIIDLALSSEDQSKPNFAHEVASAHILTGLEPLGFQKLIEAGFDVNFSSSEDPRLAILTAAFAAEWGADQGKSEPTKAGQGVLGKAARWWNSVPTHAMGVLESQTDADSLQDAILRLIRKRFSSLILTPVDQLDDDRGLAQFGVDSMIASELRTWLWTAFKVDVPFLDILSRDKTLSSLAEFVATRVVDGSEPT